MGDSALAHIGNRRKEGHVYGTIRWLPLHGVAVSPKHNICCFFAFLVLRESRLKAGILTLLIRRFF